MGKYRSSADAREPQNPNCLLKVKNTRSILKMCCTVHRMIRGRRPRTLTPNSLCKTKGVA
eukprot:876736-Prorocentrum_minimum.AAC.1